MMVKILNKIWQPNTIWTYKLEMDSLLSPYVQAFFSYLEAKLDVNI